MWATFTDFVLNNRLWKGIKDNSAVEETSKYYLNQVTEFNTIMASHMNSTHPWYMVRRVSYFCDALPIQNPQLQSNHEKNIEQTQTEGIF